MVAAGYGDQPLYDLSVSTGDQTAEKRIGLRKMEVINEVDKIGKSIIVSVNDVHVWCKGATGFPAMPCPRQTPAVYRELLEDSVAANMNMIRVWGGGQYEADCFYETCDNRGCSYGTTLCSPARTRLLLIIANCVEEIEYQGKRLRDHASIALWCGDNEVIGALTWYPNPSKTATPTWSIMIA